MRYSGFRTLPLLLCGLLMLCAWPVRAAVVQPRAVESGTVIVTAESAEVREGPSPRAEVITVVGKGEVFEKLGRTMGWYFIKLNDDSTGWISGRAIRRYQAAVSPDTNVGPSTDRYYPYYPGGYYDSYYFWGQPYLSWEWYFYDRDHSWDHDRNYYRDRDRDHNHDRPRVEGGGPSGDRPLGDTWRGDNGRTQGDGRDRGNDSYRGGDNGGRGNSESRSTGPRIRAPFMRR